MSSNRPGVVRLLTKLTVTTAAAVSLVFTLGCGAISTGQPPLNSEMASPERISQSANHQMEPAPPTRIFIPNRDRQLRILTDVKPMQPCQELIDPPRGEGVGDVYYCSDFALPGSQSEGKTVLAGHASASIDTWFNRLQAQGQSLLGRPVFIQTTASDQFWLEYTVTGVYQPSKDELPYDREVWGVPGQSTSGRLVLVTCLIDQHGDSPDNYVVVAELTDVTWIH